MSALEPSVLLRVVRGVAETSEPPSGDVLSTLTASVEQILFEDAWLVPPRIAATRAVTELAARSEALDGADDDLLQIWHQTVRDRSFAFTIDPSSWSGGDATEFLETCAVCFGVADELAPTLLIEFHQMPAADRYAILTLLSRSHSFASLAPRVAGLSAEVLLSDPDACFRNLIRRPIAAG